jgi:hypothetical protein
MDQAGLFQRLPGLDDSRLAESTSGMDNPYEIASFHFAFTFNTAA